MSVYYREYLPDQGRDPTGGLGVPDQEYFTRFGPPVTGQAACDALHATGRNPPNLLPMLTPVYLGLLARDPYSETHPAQPNASLVRRLQPGSFDRAIPSRHTVGLVDRPLASKKSGIGD